MKLFKHLSLGFNGSDSSLSSLSSWNVSGPEIANLLMLAERMDQQIFQGRQALWEHVCCHFLNQHCIVLHSNLLS